MNLSKDFTLTELCASDTAKKMNIANAPSETEISALQNLTTRLLQPLRNRYGKPLHINSGYRSPKVNKAVGGVATSQHVKGEAADIGCESPQVLLNHLKQSGLDFDQAILYPTFLHLSLKKSGKNRQQIIVK